MAAPRLDAFVRRLTGRHRVLLLGGLAVIAHGHSRATKDADLWLDPMGSDGEWAAAVAEVWAEFSETRLVRLPGWMEVPGIEELTVASAETGMVRVTGLECPLDIFREPNEIEMEDFDPMWVRSHERADGVHVLDLIDLLVSKEDTGREQDFADQRFLEAKIRHDLGTKLETATLDEARALFSRFTDHVVCERALANPDPAVRALAQGFLEELAGQGDWYSRDVLARIAAAG